MKRTSRLVALLGAASLALAGAACSPTPPATDGGTSNEDGGVGPVGDGGTPVDDGGAPVDDAGLPFDGGLPEECELPPELKDFPADGSPEDFVAQFDAATVEQARALCELYVTGVLGMTAEITAGFTLALSRCSAEDPYPATVGDAGPALDEACPDEVALLLFGPSLLSTRVDLDVAGLEQCRAEARALRAMYASIGESEQRSQALAQLLATETCLGAIQGQQAEGECCVSGWDCQDGLYCQADPRDQEVLRCLPPAGVGDACTGTLGSIFMGSPGENARVCGEGLSCVAETCSEPLGENAACEQGGAPCAEGLFCDPAANVCALLGDVDDPCTTSDQCAEGLSCLDNTCQAPVADGQACDPAAAACASACFVCRPSQLGGVDFQCLDRGATGAPCAELDDCREGFYCSGGGDCQPVGEQGSMCEGSDACAQGLYCNNNLCEPLAALGEPCQVDTAPPDCAEGSCVNGTCVAGVAGDACTGDFNCADGLLCVFASAGDDFGACTEPPAVGQPCTVDMRCAEDAFCDQGTCAALPAAGEACTPAGECAGGAFCNQGTCEALRVAGAECDDSAQCASGLCLQSGRCAASGPNCLTSKGTFLQLVLFGAVLPLVIRLRRRRR